ncbi:MAG: hypothetical protein IJ086_11525 [Clostridium sp.]|nr:hypothetical protein [Clostridium sp.]
MNSKATSRAKTKTNYTSNKNTKRSNSRKKKNYTPQKRKYKKKSTLLKKIKSKIKKKVKASILKRWNKIKNIDFTYKPEQAKNFSTTCNYMTLSIVLLTALFVYIEDSLFYAFPLITVLYVFIRKGNGNRYKDCSKTDVLLYRRILLINLFILLTIYFHYYEDLWFVNIFMFSIFLVPLGIARVLN